MQHLRNIIFHWRMHFHTRVVMHLQDRENGRLLFSLSPPLPQDHTDVQINLSCLGILRVNTFLEKEDRA